MDLLYTNDRRREYPPSWYADTVETLPPFPPLRGEVRADVCVVGGGYTGLNAALTLAERGFSVVLLEAQRVGFGASGRNGGQLATGQRKDQKSLEKLVGKDHARLLWQEGLDAVAHVKGRIARHGIDCHLKPGIAHLGFSDAERAELHEEAAYLRDAYGYEEVTPLSAGEGHALCPSPAYRGGVIDRGSAHLHPLAYALGLARAARDAGVTIHEGSEVHRIDRSSNGDAKVIVATGQGRVIADHLILGCNGYLRGLDRKVAARVMPINNFIAATEPLGERTREVLTEDVAVADTKFVVNYFRLSHDGRLLFGGGESYGYRFPSDIVAKVRRPMLEIFPHLKDVTFTHAWGGTLAITVRRLPYMARLAPNILTASGYSGHGVGTASHAGHLMALAIAGEAEGFDTMAAIPALPFPGGAALRSPLLVMAMSWYALRDRLGM